MENSIKQNTNFSENIEKSSSEYMHYIQWSASESKIKLMTPKNSD